jgi:hypothetical protein
MKPIAIPIFRPEKFGASAAEIANAAIELRAQIHAQKIEHFEVAGTVKQSAAEAAELPPEDLNFHP